MSFSKGRGGMANAFLGTQASQGTRNSFPPTFQDFPLQKDNRRKFGKHTVPAPAKPIFPAGMTAIPYQGKNKSGYKNKGKGARGSPSKSSGGDERSCKYFCSGCNSRYDCWLRPGQLTGKVPLIITCKHTVCIDCIYQTMTDNSLVCPICNVASNIPMQFVDKVHEYFQPNFYLLGAVLWTKCLRNFGSQSLNLVQVECDKSAPDVDKNEMCCYESCQALATLRCLDCSDIYCNECCNKVHNSAKSLRQHKMVALDQDDMHFELDRCLEHSMETEFLCKTCDVYACCYCIVDSHVDHTKEQLSKLSEIESVELHRYQQNAQQIYTRLLMAKTKIDELQNLTTDTAEKNLAKCFNDLHAKLQCTENKLREEIVHHYDFEKSNKGLDNVSSKLSDSIIRVKNILKAYNNFSDKKANLKLLFNKLEEVQSVPCFLLNKKEGVQEPIELVNDSILENIEQHFSLKICPDSEYVLVKENELPPDFQKDPLDRYLESESDSYTIPNTLLTSVSGSTISKAKLMKKREPKPIGVVQKKSNFNSKEMVEVTHIDDLECFYVQKKKDQYRLHQLNDDIKDFAKLASEIENPQLGEMYIVQNKTQNNTWVRGQLQEIKNGEKEPLYVMYLIDYGNTITVDVSKLREITKHLLDRQPFSIQCCLYNPTYVNWTKNAHFYMAEIIKGKDLFMFVRKIEGVVHTVELMVSTGDKELTSVIDILVHTGKSVLNTSETTSSDDTLNLTPPMFNNDLKIYSNDAKFEKNQKARVIIANVVDPHHVFVHIADHAMCLKELLTNMKTHYRKQKAKPFLPVEGSFVVVEAKDKIRGNFHRALVKEVDMEERTVTVLCVDWGTTLSVPWKKLRVLTEFFTKLESHAILIKLAHIAPNGMASKWSLAAINFLKERYQSRKELKMTVINVEPLEVSLFEMKNMNDICLNTQMVREHLADSTGKSSTMLEWPQYEADNEKVSGAGSMGEEHLLTTLLQRLEDTPEDPEDEEIINSCLKQKISIHKLVNPHEIHVRFACFESEEEELYTHLQTHYSKSKTIKQSWNVGESCVVFYKYSFTRGKILSEQMKNKMYIVDLYDQAEHESFDVKEIYVYDTYFTKYKNVSFKCHLADIRPAGGDTWSRTATEMLENIFEMHPDIYTTKLANEELESGNSMAMKMWYLKVQIGDALEANTVKHVCINDLLIRLGVAYKSNRSQVDDEEETKSEQKSMFGDNYDAEGRLKSWADIVEEEDRKIKPKSQQDSPYKTYEVDIKDWKPAFPIQNREFSARITCAETEGIIYLREQLLEGPYKKVEENMKEYFDTAGLKPATDFKWEPGQICTISYKDYWYRGRIMAVNSPDDILVVMIDFGSDHNVSATSLYREILYPAIPAFATKVKLDRVYAKCGNWLTSDYEALMDIITENATVVIKSSLDEEVPLAELYTPSGKNINDALVKVCPNLTRSLSFTTEDKDDDEDVIVMDEDIDLGLKGTHIDTTDFKLTYDTFEENEQNMTIMAVLTYNKIVVRKPGVWPPDKKEFAELTKDIQHYAHDQPVIQNVKLGMPCICLYSEDKLYYRAQVYNTEGLNCNYVFVYFVDFGNVETVSVKDIKMMRPNWFELPVRCHIANLAFELDTDNHLEYVFQFVRKLLGKTKFMRIVTKEPLTLHVYNQEDGEFFYKQLIDNRFIKLA